MGMRYDEVGIDMEKYLKKERKEKRVQDES